MNTNFLRRLGFYLGGFAMGLVILSFFLSGKKASCSYFPNARVIKNITTKPLDISPDIINKFENKNITIDSVLISTILKQGEVDFSKSDVKRDSCKVYVINSVLENKPVLITVENCTERAIVKTLSIE